MKLAIHHSNAGFHPRWAAYCEEQDIPFKRVNCHATDIIEQLNDCDGLLWHHHQMNPHDLLVAKAILSALEHSGFRVFPDWRTGWHFDDKIGQKYLFEAINAPFVPTWVFLDRRAAMDWVNSTTFPKVFKLRGGAGSSNVRLVRNRCEARRLVRRAFGLGFPNYDAWGSLKERWRKFRLGKIGPFEVAKGVARILRPPPFARMLGRETGYSYFQEFMANNDSDTRIIVIDDKAFALKRYVRDNDFRASGSGNFGYEREAFDEHCVRIGFDVTDRLGSQCAAYDFVFSVQNEPLLVEVSYGFVKEGYDPCPGYWDHSLQWHMGTFNPQGWMVEALIQSIERADDRSAAVVPVGDD
jgi:glutathione synthase/RimK-type ligase-like ATP-grasp enzyme